MVSGLITARHGWFLVSIWVAALLYCWLGCMSCLRSQAVFLCMEGLHWVRGEAEGVSMEMAVTCGGGLVMHLFVALLLGSARGRGWPCGGAGRPAPPCRSLASPRQPDCRAVLCA